MKFDGVTRFRKMNSMVKSVSSSEIWKISSFQPKLPFYPFSKKLNFSRVLHSSPLNRISSLKFTHTSTHNHMHMLHNRKILLPIGARIETYPEESTDMLAQSEISRRRHAPGFLKSRPESPVLDLNPCHGPCCSSVKQ